MQIEAGQKDIPIYRQCELIDLNRSSYYYRPQGDDAYNLHLMRLIDEQYTRTPFYGSPKMTLWLRSQGHAVNRKRVARLMRLMGLSAIYPKKKLSVRNPEHRIFPYLLNDVEIARPDQVWCSDITYIRLRRGFIYLTAIMDWFSRYVLSWKVSISLDVDFCVAALQQALTQGKPEIFNTDQGSQFTSLAFTNLLLSAGVKISMDGKGRVFDNIFVERLWRTVKYEEVYLKDYQSVKEARENLAGYFEFYNRERFHQSLQNKTPEQFRKDFNELGALPPNPQSLALSRSSGRIKKGQAEKPLRPTVCSPAPALGSVSTVALSSGRDKKKYRNSGKMSKYGKTGKGIFRDSHLNDP